MNVCVHLACITISYVEPMLLHHHPSRLDIDMLQAHTYGYICI